MTLTLTNLPGIMRYNGWYNGARLMDVWFSRPASAIPAYGPPDTTTIMMDGWVLTFPRARQVYDELVREAIWANEPAQREIMRMLSRQGLLNGAPASFGNLTADVSLLDADYINQRAVASLPTDDIDDMTAALGRFNFRVVVAGTVESTAAGAWRVVIIQVGGYVVDSFDFEGDQFLGFWDEAGQRVSVLNPLAGHPVTNADFRQWRADTGKGGDFKVFSDVKLVTLPTPHVFEAIG